MLTLLKIIVGWILKVGLSNYRMNILVHYHDLVYQHEQKVWVTTTNFGIWVNEISKHVTKVGVIAYETKRKSKNILTKLNEDVKIYSLGSKGNYMNHFERTARVKRICREINGGWDHLVVRGITPSQHLVWYNTKSEFKSFLLVRSLNQYRKLNYSPLSLFLYVRNKVNEHLSKAIIRSADIFFANSPSFFKELNLIDSKRIKFVPTNLVSIENYPEMIKKKPTNTINLLFVGRISYLKGLDELLNATKILKNKKINFNLKIVADLSSENLKYYRDLAIKFDVSEHIDWVGFIPYGSPLFEYYKNADVFILPSYTEGFPRVFWEAAIHSLPVIITSVGGIPDLLTNQKHAMLISKKDSQSIVNALLELISNDVLRHKLIHNSYELAKKYPLEKSVSIMINSLRYLN